MKYFQKTKSLSEGQNELIAKKIADIYGLICPECHIEVFNPHVEDSECIIYSRDVNETGRFSHLSYYRNLETLYQIWDGLEFKGYDPKMLMPDIIKMYIFDLVLGNYDRSPSNWGFVEINKEMHVVIFDNEYILRDDWTPHISCDLDETRFTAGYDFQATFRARKGELQCFLEASDDTFTAFVGDFLKKITPEVFEGILEEVAKETKSYIRDKDEKIQIYQRNYEAFNKIYLDYKAKRR